MASAVKTLCIALAGLLLIARGEITIDSVTSAEFQMDLYTNPFQNEPSVGVLSLMDWLDENLENSPPENLPPVTIRRSTADDYARNVSLFSVDVKNYNVIKHRKTFEGTKDQNDVVWKIRNVVPGDDDSIFRAAGQYVENDQWSYKVEKNVHCTDGSTTVDYSGYVHLSMDVSVDIQTAGDVDNYFPGFSEYYGISPDFALVEKTVTEYVTDVDIKLGNSNDKGKFTTQLRYLSDEDFTNGILNVTELPELSLKIKRENTDNWNNAYINADTVYKDLTLTCPYTSCW